ncbi:5-methylcytosine restriction system specificity protein McrC [Deinococcus sp. PEB2-63]
MPVKLNTDAVDLRRLAETNHRWKQQLGLPNLPIRIQIIDENEFTLRAEAVTGIVRVGHTDIEIAPKFLDGKSDNWQSVLWKILSVVEGGYVDSNETATEELSSLSMPDLLAEMFLASYSKGASRGLPRSYSALHSSGQTLRGKFDIQRIGVWLAKPWDLPYVADTLTENTPLARLLRWTAAQLSKTVKPPHRARAIHEIAESLSFVDKLPPHLVDAKKIFLDPQYKNLEAAKTVGILLLLITA